VCCSVYISYLFIASAHASVQFVWPQLAMGRMGWIQRYKKQFKVPAFAGNWIMTAAGILNSDQTSSIISGLIVIVSVTLNLDSAVYPVFVDCWGSKTVNLKSLLVSDSEPKNMYNFGGSGWVIYCVWIGLNKLNGTHVHLWFDCWDLHLQTSVSVLVVDRWWIWPKWCCFLFVYIGSGRCCVHSW